MLKFLAEAWILKRQSRWSSLQAGRRWPLRKQRVRDLKGRRHRWRRVLATSQQRASVQRRLQESLARKPAITKTRQSTQRSEAALQTLHLRLKADSDDDDCNRDLEWVVLVDEIVAPALPNSHEALMRWLRDFLGKSKDPGVYTFKDKVVRAERRVAAAKCEPNACRNCTKTVKAALSVSWNETKLRVTARGTHGELQKPSGGLCVECCGKICHRAAHRRQEAACVRDIGQALKLAHLPMRCDAGQLTSWAARYRKSQGQGQKQHTRDITVAELQVAAASAASFQIQGHIDWQSLPLWQLVVVPEFSEERVCAIWTCAGMIQRAQAARNKVVKLVVDGKQKVLTNDYAIVTLSFLVPSETVNKTWVGRTHTASAELNAATQQPFLQALVNTESEENILHVLNTAHDLGQKYCDLDLRNQVLQVHKDFAKVIEAARRKAFPASRPCHNYAHMRRASYNQLKLLFGVKPHAQRPQLQDSHLCRNRIVCCCCSVPLNMS